MSQTHNITASVPAQQTQSRRGHAARQMFTKRLAVITDVLGSGLFLQRHKSLTMISEDRRCSPQPPGVRTTVAGAAPPPRRADNRWCTDVWERSESAQDREHHPGTLDGRLWAILVLGQCHMARVYA